MNDTLKYFRVIFNRLRRFTLAFVSMLLLISGAAFAPASAGTPVQDTKAALDLSGTKGKVVYIDFWASWCAPCQASFPFMNELKAQYPESDFQIILVNLDHNKKKADRFLSKVNAPVPSIYDPQGKIAEAYNVSTMPTSIIIGRDGQVRYVHKGFHSEKTLKYSYHIKELLNE